MTPRACTIAAAVAGVLYVAIVGGFIGALIWGAR
jgi:hypothetical protein